MKVFRIFVVIMVITVLATAADALVKKPDVMNFTAISAKSISPVKVYIIKTGRYLDILIDHNVYAVVAEEFTNCLQQAMSDGEDVDGYITLDEYYHKYEISPSEDKEHINIFLYKFIDEFDGNEDYIKVKKRDIKAIIEYSK